MEVPVGFKWFVSGLLDASLGFGGEESAGATCLRRDGSVWTTDKDGIVLALLSGEILARTGRDPGELYADLSRDLGQIDGDRSDAPASPDQKRRLSSLVPQQLTIRELAGAPVLQVLDRAPGNQGAIGGIKVMAASGWFAARPSGTENIYKIYAESFRGPEALKVILREAQQVVDQALSRE
jgi:phosphoglucomutase